jgi:hypothetical protein
MNDKAGFWTFLFHPLLGTFPIGHDPQANSDLKICFACFRYFYIKMNRFQGYSYSK